MVVRVHLCDPSGYFRAGMRQLLEAHEGIQVVGESADCGPLAIAAPCDVLVVDASLLRASEGGSSRVLERHARVAHLIVLSMHATVEHVLHAFRAGARGYVLKDCAPHELADAVLAVRAGKRYMSPKLAGMIAAAIPCAESGTRELAIGDPLATCHGSPTEEADANP